MLPAETWLTLSEGEACVWWQHYNICKYNQFGNFIRWSSMWNIFTTNKISKYGYFGDCLSPSSVFGFEWRKKSILTLSPITRLTDGTDVIMVSRSASYDEFDGPAVIVALKLIQKVIFPSSINFFNSTYFRRSPKRISTFLLVCPCSAGWRIWGSLTGGSFCSWSILPAAL